MRRAIASGVGVVLVGPFLLALFWSSLVSAQTQAPLRGNASIASLESRLERLERQLNANTIFELLERLESLRGDIQSIRGDFETQRHDLQRIKERQRDLFVETNQIASRLEAGLRQRGSVRTTSPMAAPFVSPANESSSTSAVPASPQVPSSAQSTEVGAAIQPNPSSQSASLPQSDGSGQMRSPIASPGIKSHRNASSTPEATESGAHTTDPTGSGATFDPLQEQTAYRAAFNLLKEGRYEKAAESFRKFLTEYPGGRYTDNAQYWLGEAFYVTRQFSRALQEFRNLLLTHPQSPKVAGARLKIGFIHHELGEVEKAKTVLVEIVNQYPNTSAARLAGDRLGRLSKR